MSDQKVVDLGTVRESKKLLRQIEKEHQEEDRLKSLLEIAEDIADDLVEMMIERTTTDRKLNDDEVDMMDKFHCTAAMLAFSRLTKPGRE